MKRERGPAAASHRAFGKKHAREVDQQRPRCGWARNARRMPRTTKPGGGIGGPMELLGRFCALRGDAALAARLASSAQQSHSPCALLNSSRASSCKTRI